MADDSDADDDDSFTVTQIAVTGGSNSSVAGSSTYNSNGTSVTGTYGTLVVGANGTYTYVADQSAADDLDAGDTATDSFTYTISDGTNTDTATLIFTVTGVNDTPTGADNTVSTSEETPYVFSTSDFGYTDVDDDDVLVSVKITTLEDDGDLQYYDGSSWQDVTLNQVITVTDISNGYLRLNPDANDTGSPYTTFEFSVNDGEADSVSSYTMTINVTTVNDDPVADNETNTATEGTTTTVTDGTSDLLHGDTDTDGDTLEVSGIRTGTESGSGTFGAIATPLTGTYGSLTINSDGTYSYTPNDVLGSGETGIDYFTYTVSDGNGGTDTGQLTITVTGANDAPVGVNDSNTIDIAATSTLTVTNDSEKDVLTNDTDPDSNDTSIVTEIRTGSTEGSGTAGTLGEALIGTYGSLIMNSNGSYTYIVNEGLKDTLDPGEIVYEYFNYTVRDGSGVTDTSSIVLKLQNGGGVVKEIREKKAERIIRNQARMEARVQVENTFTELNQSTEFDLNNFEFEQTARKTDYSQGLKLVDLVAETDSLQISEGELSNLKVKDKQEGLKLKFGVMNEADNEIVKFDGKMSDGSALPEWIKINPKTGKTSANIPNGVEKIEIVIVATDKNNQTREIAVKIDPEKIKKDKQIIKKAKRTNSSITVNENGTVDIVKQKEDGSIERSFNKTLNFDNQIDINEIIETFKPEKTLELKTIDTGNDLIVNLPNELKGSFERSKLVLKDGSDVPEWLEYNPLTGEISAENPPSDLSLLELKLIIEQDGKIIVKDLEVDLQEQNVSQNFDGGENNKFVTLSDQLDKEFNDWEDYGNDLINRL
jgi:VCBS repeat-containing protein